VRQGRHRTALNKSRRSSRGGNIGGIGVHLASRVQAEAVAGEATVSSTTKDLVSGFGIAFQPRGSRQLKGVPGE
jgi:class 3 adenylate cyclase